MTLPITVLLADEHEAVRDSLATLLSSTPGFQVVGATDDGLEAVRMAMATRPSLMVFDSSMRGLSGLHAARRIAGLCPETRLLCLTAQEEASSIRSVFDAGAHGFARKRDGYEVLMEAIEAVMRTGYYVSAEVAAFLLHGKRWQRLAPIAGRHAPDLLPDLDALRMAPPPVVSRYPRPMPRPGLREPCAFDA
ncbi:MAG: Transcriptional regulatory protein DegU [Luteibacter sp.]|uniref:response regulator n=1 Tax=Luteibacter sp. TaxID=1886636 RepID=UPI001380179C|nr:response regulator transcription factor [Luteibacter sp.]KAF1008277.1 MAG: Transcriptional regulatory protein DegU [Luteibacter sp.]